MTADLAGFLSAQLDEIERVARAATPGPWRADADGASGAFYGGEDGYDISAGPENEIGAVARGGPVEDGGPNVGACSHGDADHIALHAPAFVLAWVAALRKIVQEHRATTRQVWVPEGWAPACRRCCCGDGVPFRAPCPTLLALARPFRGRPGWRDEWNTRVTVDEVGART